ncbi:MAG: sugar phosphate isomerase/epimerase [Pyrinomonas sp.]|uniref:sugar phosphate isomerase/epimerase family protein n=1 Tax=Pyrinomonas sp. TaxID=2080306 RepID=UPI003323BE06
MTSINRRQWHRLTLGCVAAALTPLGGLAGLRRINSRFRGVTLGAQSYSFRDMKLDEMLDAMREIGLGSCELWAGHVEPVELQIRAYTDAKAREELRRWRLQTPLGFFRDVRRKFERAGIEINAYNYSMRDDFTNEELEVGFRQARALGVRVLTSSSNVSMAQRIDSMARRHRMVVGMHNHSRILPDEFATPESFMRALKGTRNIRINLDIGHFVAANFDPLPFIREHHARIVTLHIKDRKRNQGPNVPFGTGDTPIRETLLLLRDNKWGIPANIEYEYKGADTRAEVRRCFEYCKQILLS